MKFDDLFPIAIIGVLVAIAQPQVTMALSAPEVSKIAAKITVLIEGKNSSGSGTIVKREGKTYTVLTCKHVVTNTNRFTIVTPDGDRYSVNAKLVKPLQPGLDLATVQFNSNDSYSVAKVGNSDTATVGTIVYISGFPTLTGGIPLSMLQFIDGKITANASQPLPDGYALVYSNDTIRGMSGGPVLNENGEVIGIHGRADTTADRQLNTIDTGLNMGIPINTFAKLSAAGVEVSTRAPSPRSTKVLRAPDFFIQGVDKYQRGDFQGAIADFNQVLRLDAKSVDAYIRRGITRTALGDEQTAMADLNQAVRLNPRSADAYNARGDTRFQLKDYQAAIEDYNQALRFNPKDYDAYIGRGNARFKLREKRKAIEDYTQAIQLQPKDAKAYYERGYARYYSGDMQAGIADYTKAIQLEPKFTLAYYYRGLARVHEGDERGAIADTTQVLRLDSNLASAYFVRSLARSQMGDKQGALADLQQAANLARQQGNTSLYRTVQDESKRLRGTGKL